jgi:16S rRNA processing protein RimM
VSGGAIPWLPPGQFYVADLEGCRVVTEEGGEVGTFVRAESGPAQDLWVVRAGDRERLIPAVADIVLRVDTRERTIVIRPPEGLLEL